MDASQADNSPSNGRGDSPRLTSRDIAAAAGVSQATVSNALNRPEVVAPATLERVRAVISDLGFVVNDSARSLRVGKSRTLGVIALDLSNPFWGEVTRGIEAAATERGYSVLLGSSEEQLDKELSLIKLFEEHRVDGILISSLDVNSAALQSLYERGTKVVFLDQTDPAQLHSSVSFNQVKGARLVGEHLVNFGHRRVGFLNIPHSMSWSRERLQGLRDGVSAAGLDPDEVITEITIDSMTAQAAEPAIDLLFETAPDVTALVCANDMVALGALKQLSERGTEVPRDLSVVGFDDSYFSSLLSPALTTIRQQPNLLGSMAAKIIIDGGPHDEPQSVMFEPELMERQSVRRLN